MTALENAGSMFVRIDFDRVSGQTFNAEGLLKPGLSVEPDVRVR
jgi:hypothetical protein